MSCWDYLQKREKSFLLLSFFVAFSLRALLISVLETYSIPQDHHSWAFGYETGRVAHAIASGDGFSSPFEVGEDIPTAWLAPVYPSLLALIFRILGTYSSNSAIAILLVNSLFASATVVAIYYLGKEGFDKKAGWISAFLFIFYPPSLWHSINTIWNTTLATLLITLLLWYGFRMVAKPSWKKATSGGVLMGITALTYPVIMAFYPFFLIWIYIKMPSNTEGAWKFPLVLALIAFIVILPWGIRNYLQFNKILLVKSTLGVELRIGNNPYATGTINLKYGKGIHPVDSKKEMMRFKRMGEIEYGKYCMDKARKYTSENLDAVLLLSAKKIYLFWLGNLLEENEWKGTIKKGARTSLIKKVFYLLPVLLLPFCLLPSLARKKDISLFYSLLFSYPLIYYIAHVSNRYRHPIEPVMIILSVFAIYNIKKAFISDN